MLATERQIKYLQHLTDRAEFIKMRHPSLIPAGLYHTRWGGMTSDMASKRIDYYNAILEKANEKMYHRHA